MSRKQDSELHAYAVPSRKPNFIFRRRLWSSQAAGAVLAGRPRSPEECSGSSMIPPERLRQRPPTSGQ